MPTTVTIAMTAASRETISPTKDAPMTRSGSMVMSVLAARICRPATPAETTPRATSDTVNATIDEEQDGPDGDPGAKSVAKSRV